MKFTLLTVAMGAMLCSNTAIAQLGVAKKVLPVVTLGAKLGVNMQQTKGDYIDDSYATGIVGGAFVGVSKKKMGIRVEGLVKSAKIDASVGGSSIKTVALDIPLMFEYALIKRLKLHVGPQFTTILSAKDNDKDVKDKLKSSDISIVGGVEVNLPLKLTVGARYIKGFTDMNNTGIAGSGTWKSSSIQLSVGYRFLN
jgi:hypothetical protein